MRLGPHDLTRGDPFSIATGTRHRSRFGHAATARDRNYLRPDFRAAARINNSTQFAFSLWRWNKAGKLVKRSISRGFVQLMDTRGAPGHRRASSAPPRKKHLARIRMTEIQCHAANVDNGKVEGKIFRPDQSRIRFRGSFGMQHVTRHIHRHNRSIGNRKVPNG